MLEKILENWKQPQLFTLVFITILITIIAIIVFVSVSKTKADKAPNTVALFAEQYVSAIDVMVDENSDGKLNKTAPYFLTLLTFLLFGNLSSLIGLEPVATSYSIPLTLALITWLGIYVVGFTFGKIRWSLRFLKNPLDIIGVQSLLISMSFRIFGNIIGGSVVLLLLHSFTAYIWGMIPVPYLNEVNILGSVVSAPFRFYFDVFGTLIQCFIFVLLSTIFWGSETVDLSKNKNNSKTSTRKFWFVKKQKI